MFGGCDVRCTHGVNVQHVDAEVVGGEVHRLENLAEGHGLVVLGAGDHLVRVVLQGFFDEPEQVLLVHARCRVDVGIDLKDEDG